MMIRRNLATMEKKVEEFRYERVHNRPLRGDERIIAGVVKALQGNKSSKLSVKKSRSLERQAEKIEADIMPKKTGVKKSGISSAAGTIKKKEQQTMGMMKDLEKEEE